MRSRRWTITLFDNATMEEMEALMDRVKDEVKFLILGLEHAPTTNAAHVQGYVEFANKKSLTQLSTLFSTRGHYEIARGSPKQNLTYCQKENNFITTGQISAQGARNDLEAIRVEIEDGATEKEIAERHFSRWVIYRESFRRYRQMINQPVHQPTYCLESFPAEWRVPNLMNITCSQILHGPPGIGKTEFAGALLPGCLFITHVDDLRHFDPDVHSGIVFDDMEFRHYPRTAQIHLLDWNHDRSIHIRYGTARIPARTRKIFTTNEEGGRIFDLDDGAIKRRVEVHYLDKL